MDLEDAVALEWMSEFTRDPAPRRIVWRQDDVLHDSFYWLSVDQEFAQAGDEVIAGIEGQVVFVQSENVETLTVLLNDDLVDLDEPVSIRFNGVEVFAGEAPRKLRTLQSTLIRRGDPNLTHSAACFVSVP
jgi:hypothetical protein